MKNSNVYAEIILSNQEDTSFTSVWGLMGTRTQEENHLAILSYS